jgi:hypothetical protein
MLRDVGAERWRAMRNRYPMPPNSIHTPPSQIVPVPDRDNMYA